MIKDETIINIAVVVVVFYVIGLDTMYEFNKSKRPRRRRRNEGMRINSMLFTL